MERWIWVTKEAPCWKELAEEKQIERCFNQPFKEGDKIIVYRSGNHRDLAYIFEVKNNSELLYEKYKTIFHKKITIKNTLKLSEMKKVHEIRTWRSRFINGFYEVPFKQWNMIIGLISKNNPDLFKHHEPKCCCGPDSEGFPINYKDSFFDLIEKIRKCKNKDSFNEEATKQLIIIPILQKMGWNTYDVCEVHPEHGVHHKSTRVDYILRDHESKQVCIEAKKVSETDFDFHEKQLLKYCAFKHADIGILTNGLVWRFYRIPYYSKDLGAIKKPPIKEISILNNDSKEILDIFIKYLWKGKISKKDRNPITIPPMECILDNLRSLKPKDRLKYNEEAMKQGIIIPFLNNLGWNTFDPKEIVFEKSIMIPSQKRHEKVDYILGKITNKIIVEVKGLGEDLSDKKTITKHEEHLLDYMEAGKHNFGVLTNGILWNFYLFKNGRLWDSHEINVKKRRKVEKKFESLISKKVVLSEDNMLNMNKLV